MRQTSTRNGRFSADGMPPHPAPRHGFSLVELLVVIVIIVIVISIIVPALGGARNVAKQGATQTLMKEFGNAVDRYRQDNAGLSPGIFRPEEMGSSENADTFGFSAMENALLALSGGIVFSDTQGTELKNFGPTQAAHDENSDLGRYVRVDLVGADYEGNPGYFQPDGKFLVAQERPSGQFGGGSDEANIPDLVDAFGNPLLLWVEDESAPDVETIDDFAREESDAGAARFYWASNAAFLKATELGREGKDQTTASSTHSLLGQGVNRSLIQTTLAGMLGSPASPAQELDAADVNSLLPASSRGRVVVQSAGINGLFVGNKERASKSFDAEAMGLRYGLTYFTAAGSRRLDASGTTSSANLIEGFDDLFQTFGN